MSNYPDGMPAGRSYTIMADCPNCGNQYETRVEEDLGMCDYLDECDTCDGERIKWCKECDYPLAECKCEE